MNELVPSISVANIVNRSAAGAQARRIDMPREKFKGQRFARHKTREEVRAQCKAAGVQWDDRLYRHGSDFTVLRGGGAEVLWSSWNGKFFGTFKDAAGKEVRFDSDSAKHDREPWMQKLLAFFYTNDPLPEEATCQP